MSYNTIDHITLWAVEIGDTIRFSVDGHEHLGRVTQTTPLVIEDLVDNDYVTFLDLDDSFVVGLVEVPTT